MELFEYNNIYVVDIKQPKLVNNQTLILIADFGDDKNKMNPKQYNKCIMNIQKILKEAKRHAIQKVRYYNDHSSYIDLDIDTAQNIKFNTKTNANLLNYLTKLAQTMPDEDCCMVMFTNWFTAYNLRTSGSIYRTILQKFENLVAKKQRCINLSVGNGVSPQKNYEINLFTYNQYSSYKHEITKLSNILKAKYSWTFNENAPNDIPSFFKKITMIRPLRNETPMISDIHYRKYISWSAFIDNKTDIIRINNTIFKISDLTSKPADNFHRIIYDMKYLIGYLICLISKENTAVMLGKDSSKLLQKLNSLKHQIPMLKRSQLSAFPKSIGMHELRKLLTDKSEFLNKIFKELADSDEIAPILTKYSGQLVNGFDPLLDFSHHSCLSLHYTVLQDFVDEHPADVLRKKYADDTKEFQCYVSLIDFVDAITELSLADDENDKDKLNKNVKIDVICLAVNATDTEHVNYISPSYISLAVFNDNDINIIDSQQQILNGVLPLYINPEHWFVSKLYYRQALIHDKTADYFPFVILHKCLSNNMLNNNEFTSKQVNLVLDVCRELFKMNIPKFLKMCKDFIQNKKEQISTAGFIGILYTISRCDDKYLSDDTYQQVMWTILINYGANKDAPQLNIDKLMKEYFGNNNNNQPLDWQKCIFAAEKMHLSQHQPAEIDILPCCLDVIDKASNEFTQIFMNIRLFAYIFRRPFAHKSIHDFTGDMYNLTAALLHHQIQHRLGKSVVFQPWRTLNGYAYLTNVFTIFKKIQFNESFNKQKLHDNKITKYILTNRIDKVIKKLNYGNDLANIYQWLLVKPCEKNIELIQKLAHIWRPNSRKMNKLVLTYYPFLTDIKAWNKIFHTTYYDSHFINCKHDKIFIDQI